MVRVALPAETQGRSYDVLIGCDILDQSGQAIAARLGERRCCVITDAVVAPLYDAKVRGSLASGGLGVLPSIIVPAGESSKNWNILGSIVTQLIERRVDRSVIIIALGGGVVGDLAGFASAITLRGLGVVQIPTTLLAMVDSAVGGKTAVDHPLGKNLVGAFHQPQLVISDLACLTTLPRRELRAGYAETVRYGLLGDAAFFEWCEQNAIALLGGSLAAQAYAVGRGCEMKAAIVAADEKDTGQRAILNLGHTFAHALEAAENYGDRLLHGEAVAIGMTLAARLSSAMDLLPPPTHERIERHFASCGLPTADALRGSTYDVDQLMSFMYRDKKAAGHKLRLVLMKALGQAFVKEDVADDAVRRVWREALGN
jgi:3-dehydroquinate synthase